MLECRPTGPTKARIMLVGEAPGQEESMRGEPFVGASGLELTRMLHEAGIMRSECFVTNVVRYQPRGNDIGQFIALKKKDITPAHIPCRDKMVLPVVAQGIELLRREIEAVQPTLIIAFGNVAMWALTGEWGVANWRGSIMRCDMVEGSKFPDGLAPKVIPSYHPAAILRQWSWRAIVLRDLRRALHESSSRIINKPAYNFRVQPGYQTVSDYINNLIHHADNLGKQPQVKLKLAVDIETRGGHIACIGFAWSKVDALCIPFMCVGRAHYWSEEEEASICHMLYSLLTHHAIDVIGQNFLYDAQYIHRHWHFIPNVARDTMIAQHTLFSNMEKGLDYLSSMYCDYHYFWKNESKEWEADMDESRFWAYNCTDAVVTYEVDEAQQKVVDQMGVRAPHDFQQSLFQPVLATMIKGLRVDHKARSSLMMELQTEMANRETWFSAVLGHPLNLRSPDQLKKLFYDDMKLPVQRDPKTKQPTTNDSALLKLMQREPLLRPFIKKLQEYRSLGVFVSTFIMAPPDRDGRMRCSFNIAGTKSFRFTSKKNAFGSGMNLQNVPGDSKDDAEDMLLELPNIRKLFVPDPGNDFFDIDLSKADLRIVVWESDEGEMKAMLREGRDPYVESAREYYRDPTITKSLPDGSVHPKYDKFKRFAHGTHYLGTPKGLAERIGLIVHEAERAQAWYFAKFPKIRAWQEDFKKQVASRRYVENKFGYRMYVFDRLEGNIYNEMVAWLPSSTVSIVINKAYHNIHHRLKEVEVLLQVHDSLAGQFPSHLGEWAKKRIIEESTIQVPYDDPLIIPVGVKTSHKSWGDCK